MVEDVWSAARRGTSLPEIALALAELDSLDSLKTWKEHPEHVVAQQR
jgi:hypothetical protein